MSGLWDRMWLSILTLALGLTGGLVLGQEEASIVAHPDRLTFPSLHYDPPHARDHRRVLENGVVGFFVEDHALPLVNISILVRAGSYLDPPDKIGLASAVGTLMRSGGTARRSAREFDEEADFLAANLGSGGGSTSSRVSLNVLSKDLEKGLDLLFEMLRTPAFQQDRVDLRRSRVLQRMERRNDDAGTIESREWARLMRGTNHHSSAQPTQATVESIVRADLIEFHRRYYHPGNLILAVSGDFETDQVEKMLQARFEGWGSGAPAPPIPAPRHSPKPGVYMVDKADVNQGRVSIGHLGIQIGNPDTIAIDLMNDVLGGSGFTSRILARVRSDEGLAYSAGSSFSAGVYYPGIFKAGFQSKSRTCAQASRIVLDEIARIRSEKVSEEELETVKNNQIEVFPRYFASAQAVAGTFASDELIGRDPDYWSLYRDRVRAVTTDEILRVARKYLQPEKLVILVVGNSQEILAGDPDRPEYSLRRQSPDGEIHTIALPDPLTLVYPDSD